ncbi:MAG: SAM-dependent methyltransferase [Aquabacterium sp.]|nr:MAG: SAM-dependent methyltransferase [Aquabacterium sp.]
MTTTSPDTGTAERFFTLVEEALAQRSFVRLVLAKNRGPQADLERIDVRLVELRGADALSFVHHHKTRDLTKNLPPAEGLALVRSLLGPEFKAGHLHTTTQEIQLGFTKKGQAGLHTRTLAADEARAADAGHNREKQRFVDPQAAFLVELGVMDAQHRLVPAMSRKWKQINKFVEVFSHAWADAGQARQGRVRVLDFGSGKGYLTFALHDHLSRLPGCEPQVTGVELRPDMVELCNGAVRRLGLKGLDFREGDVRSFAAEPVDVMIALHACDTATDHAIHMGIRANAAVILCSPCCHKQLRPQMKSPAVLRPLLDHGIHLGQEAEMLTDGLRALLLESEGYATQVFEFISLEHTSKNKMILAVKRGQPLPAAAVLEQIRALKEFYGVREQCLEALLRQDGAACPA